MSSRLTRAQQAVATVAAALQRFTDEELVRAYEQTYRSLHLPRQSPSGIRTRRKELGRRARFAGHKKRMRTGGWGRVWLWEGN